MNDNGKTKEQLIQELEDLRPRIAELEKTETEYQQAEETMQGQIKELDCFYNISALLELPGITLDEIMKRTVMLLPPAWQFPEITTACIVLEGQAFQTEHFRETSWMQTREIIVHGKPVGQVEVCYLEERLARDEGPFLKEERKLLNAITERLGHIIERIKAEETLRESEEKYRSLVENISDVIFDVDHQGVVLYFSPLGKDIWGYNREDVIGKNFIELIHPDDRDLLLQRFVELSDGVEKPLSYRFKDKAGNFRWVRSNTKPRIENGIFVGASGTLIDITKQKEVEALLMESEKKYRELSIIDDLTQLYNSRHFYFQLKIELDRSNRYELPLTLLMLDLDNFKAFNDAYGHVKGDQVLMRIGQVLKRCLRETDFAYRYGGEEFTILLPMTTSADGAVTAERIRTEFKKEAFSPAPGQDVHVTVSIGIAQYKQQEEMKAFVHRVDQLMYQAKKNGKDRARCEP